MKKNQKGFTLIELLAVIIILAIIALIAVPTVMNLIDKSRKSASKESANGLVSAAELWHSEAMLDNGGTVPNVTVAIGTATDSGKFKVSAAALPELITSTFTIKGTMPSVVTNFKISNNGKVSFDKVNINGYCWKYGAELSSVACS